MSVQRAAHDKWFAQEYPELWPHVDAGEIGSALDVWNSSWKAWSAALAQPQSKVMSDGAIIRVSRKHMHRFITGGREYWGSRTDLIAFARAILAAQGNNEIARVV